MDINLKEKKVNENYIKKQEILSKEKRITLEKIENGYLLIENIEYEFIDKNNNKNWKTITRKYYYPKNPLKKEKGDELADMF